MLKKKHRLAKTKDVKHAFARGRGFFYPLFTVKFAKVSIGHPRFTVVVSTKVSKKAVERNRIKRILREYIRLNLHSLAVGDYAIIVKPLAANAASGEIRTRFEQALTQAKLMVRK